MMTEESIHFFLHYISYIYFIYFLNEILQTIQIFLPDGSPTSVKIAEITNRVVKSVLVQRNKLEYMFIRQELINVSIYS